MLVVITKGELTKIGLSKLRETTGDLGGTCVHLILRLCTCVHCALVRFAHLFLRLYTFYLALVNMVHFCALFLCFCIVRLCMCTLYIVCIYSCAHIHFYLVLVKIVRFCAFPLELVYLCELCTVRLCAFVRQD